MTTYNVTATPASTPGYTVVRIGFNPDRPASNTDLVVDATAAANAVRDQVAGTVACLNGPASLPVAVALAHVFLHVCPAVAVWDPKLQAYVVAVSHDPAHVVGDTFKLD